MNHRLFILGAGRRSIAGGLLLAAIWTTPTRAQDETLPPLARYVPAEGLAILIEHDGLDARPAAWEGDRDGPDVDRDLAGRDA